MAKKPFEQNTKICNKHIEKFIRSADSVCSANGKSGSPYMAADAGLSSVRSKDLFLCVIW